MRTEVLSGRVPKEMELITRVPSSVTPSLPWFSPGAAAQLPHGISYSPRRAEPPQVPKLFAKHKAMLIF